MKLEVIESKRIGIFEKLGKFSGFHLVGGTALALQIGHRISVDFDLFSRKEIKKGLLKKVRDVFKGAKIEIKINNQDHLAVEINGTKIDFVKYPFDLTFNLTKFHGINMAEISEIAVMKAFSMGRRPTLKDYVDIYFILKEKHISLEKIMEIAEKKYKHEFNRRLFLEQLTYWKDIKPMKIYYLKENPTNQEIEEFFKKEVKRIKI